jgi:hypothetical protein
MTHRAYALFTGRETNSRYRGRLSKQGSAKSGKSKTRKEPSGSRQALTNPYSTAEVGNCTRAGVLRVVAALTGTAAFSGFENKNAVKQRTFTGPARRQKTAVRPIGARVRTGGAKKLQFFSFKRG